jgi:hypothetical protein
MGVGLRRLPFLFFAVRTVEVEAMVPSATVSGSACRCVGSGGHKAPFLVRCRMRAAGGVTTTERPKTAHQLRSLVE